MVSVINLMCIACLILCSNFATNFTTNFAGEISPHFSSLQTMGNVDFISGNLCYPLLSVSTKNSCFSKKKMQ